MLVRNPKEIETFLREHRHSFDTPQCYLGTEPNTHKKDWNDPEIKLRILFASCSRYEDFRGNQTIPLIYQMLNERKDILCDRAFFPNTEKEYKLFRKYHIPIFGLETKRSMGEYDIVMTSLSFLPPWVNFPLMLDMSGIPAFNHDRSDYVRKEEGYPIIMIGGSSMYGNFCVAFPVVDIIYLGDAEPGLLPLLEAMMQGDSLADLQEKHDYILVPQMFNPTYHDEIFDRWIMDSRVPAHLKIIRQKKLDDAPALTRPLPSFTDTTMGLGEIEISRGCRGVCAFCGIGWKYRPYRERSKEKMVELMKENRFNSGATTLCPIATEFAYYSQKQALINELFDIAYYADPLSMRIDAFIDDPDFDDMLRERGMNQLALGVEAPSQRLRNRLMKGITEKQILRACEIAIQRGFKRIKFFMISNIDEEWEDFEEFFALLRKVRAIGKGTAKGIRTGWDINITCSWTPLFVEPCTPLQWKKPTIEQRKDWKRVDEILRGELKCKFKLGIKNSEDFLWTMQGMHLGDTRFAEALVLASLELRRPFYVSFTRKMKTVWTKHLAESGLDWTYILRERQSDEEFPWDIVDRGVSKKTLRKKYEDITLGKMDDKLTVIPVPVDRTDFSHYNRDNRRVFVEPDYWYMVRYTYPDGYAVVPNTHLKAMFHRAAYQMEFPLVVNKMHFFADRDARNWYEGSDFFAVSTYKSVDLDDFIRLNEKISPFLVTDIELIGSGNKHPAWREYYGSYFVGANVGELEAEEAVVRYNLKRGAGEPVMVAIPSTRYFAGTFTKKKIDMQENNIMGDVAVVSEWGMPNYCQLGVKLGYEVGIRYFLQALFPHISFSRILLFNVKNVHILRNKVFVL